jgi:hypothetical protein
MTTPLDTMPLVKVDNKAMHRAASWLRRHAMYDIVPAPWLAARLDARRHAIGKAGAVCAALLSLAGLTGLSAVRDRLPPLVIPILYAVGLPMTMLIFWLLLHRAMLRVGRSLGATVTRRVTHPTPPGWRLALGSWRIAATAVSYPCALMIVVGDAMYAPDAVNRPIVTVFLVGLAALAAATLAVVVGTLRRPAVAYDTVSLAIDDELRAEEARQFLTAPVPVLLALTCAAAQRIDAPDWLTAGASIYAQFAVLLFLVSFATTRPHRMPVGQRRPTTQ